MIELTSVCLTCFYFYFLFFYFRLLPGRTRRQLSPAHQGNECCSPAARGAQPQGPPTALRPAQMCVPGALASFSGRLRQRCASGLSSMSQRGARFKRLGGVLSGRGCRARSQMRFICLDTCRGLRGAARAHTGTTAGCNALWKVGGNARSAEATEQGGFCQREKRRGALCPSAPICFA